MKQLIATQPSGLRHGAASHAAAVNRTSAATQTWLQRTRMYLPSHVAAQPSRLLKAYQQGASQGGPHAIAAVQIALDWLPMRTRVGPEARMPLGALIKYEGLELCQPQDPCTKMVLTNGCLGPLRNRRVGLLSANSRASPHAHEHGGDRRSLLQLGR